MLIKGIFIDGCGFIEARLVSNSLKLDEKVNFLVDTGASRTTLLDKDALWLSIRYDKLTFDFPRRGVNLRESFIR